MESPFVKLPVFADTTCYIDKSVPITWSEIYQTFSRKEVLKEEEDHEVYINVKKSWFHKVAPHLLILPCVGTIEWIIQWTNEKYMMTNNIHCVTIESFISSIVFVYYKMPWHRLVHSEKWYYSFSKPTRDILKYGWEELGKFRYRKYIIYTMNMLRKPIKCWHPCVVGFMGDQMQSTLRMTGCPWCTLDPWK